MTPRTTGGRGRATRRPGLLLLVLAAVLALPGLALAHPERTTFFPDHTKGSVPEYRSTGPSLVVCKKDSATLIKRSWAGKGPKRTRIRNQRLKMLDRCRFAHIQAAVDAAKTGDRILIMPGVYREEPSRAVKHNDPKCSFDDPTYWEPTNDGHGENGKVPTYQFHWDCKNSRNLVQIMGDDPADTDLECDQKCDLQIEGMGRRARDVLVQGDRIKDDVIRADRADGVQIRNLTAEQAAFNNIDVVETNGFQVVKLVVRGGQNYGVLTFTSDNGRYRDIEAYNNGDSGIYPGSGPEGGCKRFGIVIDNVRSYNNVLGFSGTAGNGTLVRNSKFFDNAAGISNDSFASGHPGMPQDCSAWRNNDINSNNVNYFADDNEAYCNSTPFAERDPERVCPQFQVPVGAGIILYGANRNIVEGNRIYDNWRSGVRLFYVPAVIRGENDPAKQFDTSNGNRIEGNAMGVGPGGRAMPNGEDFTWDEQGVGNCWQGNTTASGPIVSSPPKLPTCDSGGSRSLTPNAVVAALEVPCATWNPRDNPDPPGCTWFTTPKRPAAR